MIRYFFRRFLAILPKLLIISIIIFLGLQLLPGDPITRSISPEVLKDLSEAQLEELRDQMGLNDPLPIQYFHWIGDILQGNFGYSQVSGSSIASMLAARLPATLELAGIGLLLAMVFGIALGFLSAVKQNSIVDYVNTVFGIIGISVPEFFFGLIFIVVFALHLKWFPTGGRISYGEDGFFDRIRYLVMPSVCLGIAYIATLMRITRDSMLDVLHKEYIKTARSKGLTETEVNWKHGFRNCLLYTSRCV